MSSTINPHYLECTIHDLKTNISRYLRLLEDGHYRALVVKRYNRPVGMFVPYRPPRSETVAAVAADFRAGTAARPDDPPEP